MCREGHTWWSKFPKKNMVGAGLQRRGLGCCIQGAGEEDEGGDDDDDDDGGLGSRDLLRA